MITLGIETSCDETSVAVLDGTGVLSNVIYSQLFHSEYGGVVPEVASREHLKKIVSLTELALKKAGKTKKDIELVAATAGPGLIGALLTGLNFGKSVSASIRLPFVPVNHIAAHLYSNILEKQPLEFPFIGLIVSGGHTLIVMVREMFDHEILGSTADDAAGEAFDKAAKLLGLGYPGGQLIDKYAKEGNEDYHKFPLSKIKDGKYDFSFSGIKTSLRYFLEKINFDNNMEQQLVYDICASYQRAIIESLFLKTFNAAKDFNVKRISISGGVSANSLLRKKFDDLKAVGFEIYYPRAEYSTDNAAMVALTGYLEYKHSENKQYYLSDSLKENAFARLDYENF